MNILTLIKDFLPTTSCATDWRLYATGNGRHPAQVAIWGAVAVVCAVPLGILSSDNIVPWWVTIRAPHGRLDNPSR